MIKHAMILSRGRTLDVDVPKRASSETDATGNLKDMERMRIVAVLEKTGRRIAGQGGADHQHGRRNHSFHHRVSAAASLLLSFL
jgi:hypothetical protein